MKPNDKAYAVARKVAYNRINESFVFDLIKEAVDAAYAAQFQSENYAGLVKELREDVLQFNLKDTVYENIANEAADAIETLLAKLNSKPKPSEDYAVLIDRLRFRAGIYKGTTDDRAAADALEALLAERDRLNGVIQSYQILLETQQGMLVATQTERDALLARLAPVDDKELVEIVVNEIRKQLPASGVMYIHIANAARAAIAATRPHIEAAERERCAKTCRELDKRAEEAGVSYPSGHVCALEIMKSPQQSGGVNE